MKLPDSISELRRAALDLVYPPGCAACGIPVESFCDSPFCQMCHDELALFDELGCQRCGVPVPVGASRHEPCPQCQGEVWHFDRTIAAGLYEGLLQQLIVEAKGPAHDALARSLADCLWDSAGYRLRRLQFDAICPVPMHWYRRWWRLANSAEIMVERLSELMGVRMRRRLLTKVRHTPRQATLPRTKRLTNLRGAFVGHLPRKLRGGHILVVDDVLTTGATCSEAARVLKQAGAAEVTIAVVARTLKGR